MKGSDESGHAAAGEKVWLALLLAWVAGFVDALGYMVLRHTFTSHMSGNTVAMGAFVATHDWTSFLHRTAALPSFVIGLMAGAMVEIASRRGGVRHQLAINLGLETMLLLAFLLLSVTHQQLKDASRLYPLIALVSMAMGLQSATLRRVRGQSVHTTFVTGMLIRFAENAVALLFHVYDRICGTPKESAKAVKSQVRAIVFYAGIWLAFVGGAACGAISEQTWGVKAVLVPICALVPIAAFDVFIPFESALEGTSTVEPQP